MTYPLRNDGGGRRAKPRAPRGARSTRGNSDGANSQSRIQQGRAPPQQAGAGGAGRSHTSGSGLHAAEPGRRWHRTAPGERDRTVGDPPVRISHRSARSGICEPRTRPGRTRHPGHMLHHCNLLQFTRRLPRDVLGCRPPEPGVHLLRRHDHHRARRRDGHRLLLIERGRRRSRSGHRFLRGAPERRHRTRRARGVLDHRNLHQRRRHLPDHLLGRSRSQLRLHLRRRHREHHRCHSRRDCIVRRYQLRPTRAPGGRQLRRLQARRIGPGDPGHLWHRRRRNERCRQLPDHLLGRSRSELRLHLHRRHTRHRPEGCDHHRIIGEHRDRLRSATGDPDLRRARERRHRSCNTTHLLHHCHRSQPTRCLSLELFGRIRSELHVRLRRRHLHRHCCCTRDGHGFFGHHHLRRCHPGHHPDLRRIRRRTDRALGLGSHLHHDRHGGEPGRGLPHHLLRCERPELLLRVRGGDTHDLQGAGHRHRIG